MSRKHSNETDHLVPMVRGIISYFCVITIFGCVSLVVHASMMEKRIRYSMTDKNFEKMRLLDELRKIDNQIGELESYSRISNLIEDQLPFLGPPRHSAIDIAVPGLRSHTEFSDWAIPEYHSDSFIDQFRYGWKEMQRKFRAGLQSLVE